MPKYPVSKEGFIEMLKDVGGAFLFAIVLVLIFAALGLFN